MTNIPIFVIAFNRVTVLKKSIESYQKYFKTPHELIIIDHGSDYDPCIKYLKYLEQTGITVIRCKQLHPHPMRSIEMNLNKALKDWYSSNESPYYVLTDPDIEFNNYCPGDILEVYAHIMDTHPNIRILGPRLRTDDIPDCYLLKNEVIDIFDKKYYNKPIHNITYKGNKVEFIYGWIDTTFIMCRKGEFVNNHTHKPNIVNVCFPYDARHLDWYIDVTNLAEDQFHYLMRSKSGSNWGTWKLKNAARRRGIQVKMNENGHIENEEKNDE